MFNFYTELAETDLIIDLVIDISYCPLLKSKKSFSKLSYYIIFLNESELKNETLKSKIKVQNKQ